MENMTDNMIGKRLDGRYEILEVIGAGGMADIYKAKDITEDKVVAVKILKNEFAGSEDFLRRFRNESKAIALLSHPNIVKIFDVGFNDDLQFIVMEYIDGISLAEFIETQGVLKWKDAIYFTVQILRALQHAHDRGIVHRDIKSQNVMLLSDGTIKVMDFGIARFNRESDKTLSEKTIGSVHYISPEQARGEMTDERSDIYSVGIMLYEMLTGRKPFDGETAVSIAIQHMQTQAKKPRDINPSIPEGLEEITLKAMEKDPAMRYLTAGEMMSDIEQFKKDPSIVFEYGGTAAATVSGDTQTMESAKTDDDDELDDDELDNLYDDLYDEDDDEEEDEEIEERRSPLLSILLALLSIFVIMTAWLIFSIVNNSLPGETSGAGELIMPNIINMSLEEIQEKYPDIYDNLVITRKNSTEYEADHVMDQEIPANRAIKSTTTIKIVVSDGPKQIELEDLSNLTYEDAKYKLEKQELKAKIIKVDDEEVQANYVIRTEPPAHSMVKAGTEVKVYVSNGKSEFPVNVPKFVGLTREEAEELAAEKKLVLKIVEAPNNEYEEGIVFEQNIPENSLINEGDEVELMVSNGENVNYEEELVIELPADAADTGSFFFQYFKDGLQINQEMRDMSVNAGKSITIPVEGSGVVTYTIKIENYDDESLNGLFAEYRVDFTNEEVVIEQIAYNPGLFKELKIEVPETTEPPATEPPATEPPATEPPATEPPATEPPATEPPATEPPATEPPATEPPATEPPATEVPASDEAQAEAPPAE